MTKQHHNYLSLTLINARSLTANIDIITNFIIEYRFSIIAITESWLKNVDTVIPAGLKSLGYKSVDQMVEMEEE